MQDKLDEIFRDLKEHVEGLEGDIALIEIRQATPTQYPCRVYLVGEEDFEGVFISFD